MNKFVVLWLGALCACVGMVMSYGGKGNFGFQSFVHPRPQILHPPPIYPKYGYGYGIGRGYYGGGGGGFGGGGFGVGGRGGFGGGGIFGLLIFLFIFIFIIGILFPNGGIGG